MTDFPGASRYGQECALAFGNSPLYDLNEWPIAFAITARCELPGEQSFAAYIRHLLRLLILPCSRTSRK